RGDGPHHQSGQIAVKPSPHEPARHPDRLRSHGRRIHLGTWRGERPVSNPSAFSEKERADLVAYLDGELEGDAARALEQKLALDPAARAEADDLKRTWDLLDFLPKSEPSPNFTHRTLDRLRPVATASQPVSRRGRPWWRPA